MGFAWGVCGREREGEWGRTDWPSPPVHPIVVGTPAWAPELGNWVIWMEAARVVARREVKRVRVLSKYIIVFL